MSNRNDDVIYMDTGGTFSDAVIIKGDGSFVSGKALTTPSDLETCFFNCIEAAARGLGQTLKETLSRAKLVGYGTTAGTNALITLQGPKLGLIITKGFEDVTIMMRGVGRWAGIHPLTSMHVPETDKPEPIVPRSRIKGVTERVDTVGNVIVPLYRNEVRQAVKELMAEEVEGIAVCLLCSYVNNVHEKIVYDIIKEMAPDMTVAASYIVSPLIREYARANSTIADLFVGKAVRVLLSKVKQRLHENGYDKPLLIMQAAGGLSRSEVVRPITTLHSGPVGGLVGVEFFTKLYGENNMAGSDMGGTSFDLSIVPEGGPKFLREPVVSRYHLQNPMKEIITIGAGGGTIAYLDEFTGRLRVGPKSAGSVPGPVCYDRGGTVPTVTDADVVMGRIDANYFLGGTMKLNKEKATQAIREKIAYPLGMSVADAAQAICTIIDNAMKDIVHTTFTMRGLDTQEFSLISFGGAGPVHAAGYSKALGFKRVIIPPYASTFSAFGASTADVMHRYESSPFTVLPGLPFDATSRRFEVTTMESLPHDDIERFNRMSKQLEDMAYADMKAEGFASEEVSVVYPVRMRYGGQLDEVEFHAPLNNMSSPEDINRILRAFEDEYIRLYSLGATYPEGGVEIMGIAIQVSGKVTAPQIVKRPYVGKDSSVALKGKRDIYFDDKFMPTNIYEMKELQVGNLVPGPAIIEATDTTLVVPPDRKVTVDEYLNMVMEEMN